MCGGDLLKDILKVLYFFKPRQAPLVLAKFKRDVIKFAYIQF